MTPLERTLATLRGEPTDRTPVIGGFITNADYLAYAVGITVEEFWRDPERHALDAYRRVEADVIVQFVLPKKPEIETLGAKGQATNFTRSDHSWRERFPNPESVIEFARSRPSPHDVTANFDAESVYDFYVRLMLYGAQKMAPMVWVPGHIYGCPPFQHGYDEFGYENYLSAMYEAPDVFRAYFDSYGEQRRLENIEIVHATRDHDFLPLVYCGQDICYGAGPICSPELLREIYFPALRRAFEPLVEAGIEIVWHSDGYIIPILEDLLDAGVTGFQGFEEDHGMSLSALAEMRDRSERPLVLWGSVSVTSTLPFGTPDDVRRDVERCVEIGRRTGSRLFLAPSSSVGPEVPIGNIDAFFDRARSLTDAT